MTRKPLAAVPELEVADNAAEERDAFARAAPGKRTYPWQRPGVRPDIAMPVSTKIPEDLWLQVGWLADNGPHNRMAIIEGALRLYVKATFERMGVPLK